LTARVTVAVWRYGPEPETAPIAVTLMRSPARRTSYGVSVVLHTSSASIVEKTTEVAEEVTPAERVVLAEEILRAELS
jgi:hypothetical protein